MTNFRIFDLESRLFGPRRRILSAGSLGVRRGLDQALECPGRRRSVVLQLVGPWQYQYWVPGGCWVVPRYSTLPVPPSQAPPRVLPTPPCTKLTVQYTVPHTQFEAVQGDPRGRITQVVPGHLNAASHTVAGPLRLLCPPRRSTVPGAFSVLISV